LIDTFIGTLASAPGNGGDVTIAGKDVTFTRSAVFTDVDAGSFDLATEPNMGLVHPGSVTVTAKNTVTFSGSYADDPGLFPVISTRSVDTLLDAGSVTIAGKIVNLSNGSINVSNSSGKGIPSTSNAGNIAIRGDDINLSQFTITSDNAYGFSGTGKGGNILLGGIDNHLANNIQLMDSRISASSVSSGGSGNVEFQTQELTLNNAIVQADAFAPGPAGSPNRARTSTRTACS